MTKGAATTISSILIIIFLGGMLFIYTNTVDDEIQGELEVAFKKSDIMRTKNTFYLVNSSLEITWFISTVQMIFEAGRDFPPGLCDGNTLLEQDLKDYMEDIIENYEIGSFKINYVDIDTKMTPDIRIENDKITSDIEEEITAAYVDTEIVADASHENIINTYFKKLAEYSCIAIAMVPDISSGMPPYTTSTPSKTAYLNSVENHIRNMLDSISLQYGITKEVVTDLWLSVSDGFSGLTLDYEFDVTFYDVNEYYYHDEENNRFVEKLFSLDTKQGDSVDVLICTSDALYNWISNNDMICYNTEIYTCDRDIDGLNSEHKIELEHCLHSEMECNSDHSFKECGFRTCVGYCEGLTYYEPATATCDETCINGLGCYCECDYVPVSCDDNNICTNDFCDSSGCYHTLVDCTDGDPCTNDYCNPSSGCYHTPVDCGEGAHCEGGVCIPD